MQKFKALIIDLDGTTIPSAHHGDPKPAIVKAILNARKKVKVSVATGRSLPFCRNVFKAFKLEDPCIISAGTTIINPKTEKIIWQEVMTPKQVNQILEICKKYSYEVFLGGDWKSWKIGESFTGEQPVIYILGVTKEDARDIEEALIEVPDLSVIGVMSWHRHSEDLLDIHITKANATKKYALQKLTEMLSLKKEEIIAVGDSLNDVPMFEAAGFKVAMGNAVLPLKDVADYIAPTVEEDGLVDVINKFIL